MGIFNRKKKTTEIKHEMGSINNRLTEAVAKGKPEKVIELLQLGADINHITAMGNTVLQYACNHSSNKMINLLMNQGADLFEVDQESGFTLLHAAASNGNLWLVKRLVEKGLDPNAKDSYGNGPLWRAGKHHEIGTYLMDNGANPKMENNHGISPYSSDAEAFAWIKDKSRIIPDERTDDIFKAIKNKDLTSIALLTVQKHDFNQKNKDGKTPLICAIEDNYVDIILLLIKNGAKTNIADTEGNTPLALAQALGHKEIEIILAKVENQSA